MESYGTVIRVHGGCCHGEQGQSRWGWAAVAPHGACAYATLRQSVANLMFRNVSFNFATAISKFDTFSSYHIVLARITKVTASFSLFALSELVFSKNVFYPILLFPTCSPQASSPLEHSGQTDGQISTPLSPLLLSFSTERAGPYPQAQLYWAGRTMGWMAV